MTNKKIIYCYETKEQFDSIAAAQKKYNIKGIVNVLDKPNKTAGNFHWVTSLDNFKPDELSVGKTLKKTIYCVETGEQFNSLAEATLSVGLTDSSSITRVLDKPNRTAGNYHWVTSLDKTNEINKAQVTVYCYETKEQFSSVNQAKTKTNINNIEKVLNNPNRTAGNYHWCTDLAIFDKIKDELTSGKDKIVPVFCYETREKFDSIKDAQTKYGAGNIGKVLDNPNKVDKGYHWCTDLEIFDEIMLHKGRGKIIYCYETKEKFNSIKEASIKYNIVSANIIRSLDDPNKTAGNYHWCTDLSIFDGYEFKNIKQCIYCYETGEKFESVRDALVKTKINNINSVIDNHKRTAGGHHWFTNLDNVIPDELVYPTRPDKDSIRPTQPIFCYETKERFESASDARNKTGISNINSAVDNPNRTAGDYHWCTDLAIFDGVKLSSGHDSIRIPVYCYETKERFESIEAASKYMNFKNSTGIINIVNNPNRTAGNFHWCTDLTIFDGVDLVYPDSGTSAQEKEIVDFIKSIYKGEVITNTKSIISPYELDIYIPDLKLAFEFNGNYWHSEAKGKDKNYHINKTNLCKKLGIQLIHIFEYQWEDKSNNWKAFILNKLKTNPVKIYARKCSVTQIIDNTTVNKFLEENHLQGLCNSSINIGLYYNDILVSVMTFGKPRFNKSYEYELIRFCNLSGTNVIGGASKLLKYFEINFEPKSIISYANLQWSDGNIYNKLGFNYINNSNPNYVWFTQGIIYKRYQTMKHKLADLLEVFDPELTEAQNMENNGFMKLWDCGNMVFVKEY